MRLHLRPIPDDIEFCLDYPGLHWRGIRIEISPAQVRMFQFLYERQNFWCSIRSIMLKAGIKRTVVKVFISQLRPVFNQIGYSIRTSEEDGYKLEKMK